MRKKGMLAGIDVGATELVVAGVRDGTSLPLAHFANDSSGHKQLIRWLTKGGRTAQVGLEATGVYGLVWLFIIPSALQIKYLQGC